MNRSSIHCILGLEEVTDIDERLVAEINSDIHKAEQDLEAVSELMKDLGM